MEKVQYFIYLQFILKKIVCKINIYNSCIFEKSIWMHLNMWFFNIIIVKFLKNIIMNIKLINTLIINISKFILQLFIWQTYKNLELCILPCFQIHYFLITLWRLELNLHGEMKHETY
jgi:hypothetical protein